MSKIQKCECGGYLQFEEEVTACFPFVTIYRCDKCGKSKSDTHLVFKDTMLKMKIKDLN